MAISVNKRVSEMISWGGGLGTDEEGICNSAHKDCAIITTDRVEGFGLGFWNYISCV